MTPQEEETTNPRSQKLSEKLISSGMKTREFFLSISGDEWYQQVYSEGANWAVFQILSHFVAAEASIVRLIKFILKGNRGVPKNFNLDAFNEREIACFSKLPNSMILQHFMEKRGETIELVMNLNDADLAIKGRHPWLGVVPIEEMIKLMYRHNQIHQRDIRRTLAS